MLRSSLLLAALAAPLFAAGAAAQPRLMSRSVLVEPISDERPAPNAALPRFTLHIWPPSVPGTTSGLLAGAALRVGEVHPNPTAGAATLALRVDAAQAVRAAVYDALGREVAVLHDGAASPEGELVLALDGAGLAPGVYVVRLEGETFVEARRLTVVR
jgi:hypothetical protein